MASTFNGIELEDGRLRQILSPPNPQRQLAQPLASTPRRISHSISCRLLQWLPASFEAMRTNDLRADHQQRDAFIGVSAPFSIHLRRPAAMSAPTHERAGQGCFLCLEKGHNQIAIPVPCSRPRKLRQVKYTIPKRNDTAERTV
jgi:hypothetical protein